MDLILQHIEDSNNLLTGLYVRGKIYLEHFITRSAAHQKPTSFNKKQGAS